MAEVLDWQRVADPGALVHYAVGSLRQGRIVVFPTETGYVVTASALVPEAVRRLRDNGCGGSGVSPAFSELSLVVRGAAEARDWAPALSPLGQRLARRLWPGPVTLIVGGDVEHGLASRLPEEVRSSLCLDGTARLTASGHEALREVLRYLPGPLVLAAASAESRADLFITDGGRAGSVSDRTSPPVADAPGSPTVIAVNGDAWEIVRPGALSAEEIRRRTAYVIVFVCTGNTCRSPLAEALCKKLLADRLGCTIEDLPARGYQVMSAGLAASAGGAAAVEAEQAARGFGADLSAHRSQPLTLELAERADYLFGMTHSHLRALTDSVGHLGIALRLLDPDRDIADPLGGDQPVYNECAQQIWRRLEALLAEIVPAEAQHS